jgi:hypothetical protein
MRRPLQLDREEVGPWVQPYDELRPLALDRVRNPVGEVRRRDGGHRREGYCRPQT